ncbi:MAG TPA: hypothetical protein VNA24_27395 [Hyalangium sp.]|nr:hypothetical protein [Hyalangium sp.]
MVVTFDEADYEAAHEAGNASVYDGPNQIYTVLLGDMIEPGGASASSGLRPYVAGGPLAMAELAGVILLVHPGVSNLLLQTQTFSISGVMTPNKPVSYKSEDSANDSNGFGTMAEAGWSQQLPIHGTWCGPGGGLSMARVGAEVVIAFQPEARGAIHLCIGHSTGLVQAPGPCAHVHPDLGIELLDTPAQDGVLHLHVVGDPLHQHSLAVVAQPCKPVLGLASIRAYHHLRSGPSPGEDTIGIAEELLEGQSLAVGGLDRVLPRVIGNGGLEGRGLAHVSGEIERSPSGCAQAAMPTEARRTHDHRLTR